MRRSTLSSARLLPKSLEMLRSSTAGGADVCSPDAAGSCALPRLPEAPGVPLPVNDNPLLLLCCGGQFGARQRRQPQQPAEAVYPVRSPAAGGENVDGVLRGGHPVRADGLL